jgi:hypothetical protein
MSDERASSSQNASLFAIPPPVLPEPAPRELSL